MAHSEQFLEVSIAGQALGLPLSQVLSLLRADNVQYSPSRRGPLGWFLDPEEIEIWQLHRLYGVEPPDQGASPCVQLRGHMPRALLVDEVHGKIEVSPDSRFPTLPLAATHPIPLIGEIAVVDDRALPLLNIDALGTVDTATVAQKAWEAVSENRSAGQHDPQGSIDQGFTRDPTGGEKALRISIASEVALVLPLSQIRAVSSNMTFVQVPASPDIVAGVAVWDGEITYGVDWGQIIGPDRGIAPAGSQRWIVAASRLGQLIFFPASSTMGTIDEDTSLDMIDTTPFPYPSVTAAAATFQDQLLVIPDLDALVAMESQEVR